MIRVKITARHRRVLMASHTLEKVQIDAGASHPGQRRVSQAVPHEPGQPKIINQLVNPVASRRVAVVITPCSSMSEAPRLLVLARCQRDDLAHH